MDHTMDSSTDAPRRRWGRTAALVTGGVLVGAVAAGAVSANAATTSPTTPASSSSSSSSTADAPSGAPKGFDPGGSTPVRSDEKQVTGSDATTLTTKAEAKVPGATVIRVETDAGDAAYEVHMKKSDGTLVTVKFDKNLDVTAVEDGMGKGDPAPSGGQGGPNMPQGNGAPQGAPSGTTTG